MHMHMQMGRDLWLFLAIASLLITGLAAGGENWNILKYQKKKHMQSAVLGNDHNGDNNNSLKKYCESWRMNVEVNNIRGFDVVPQECIDHIGKYMTSSQYKSDSERAMEESSLYLSNHFCNFKGDGKDAWIFDVDDTLLSTLPYFKKHKFGGLEDEYKEVQSYKAEARKRLVEEGYQIWGIIGDQWSSFDGLPAAKRTFKLPNSLYYVS